MNPLGPAIALLLIVDAFSWAALVPGTMGAATFAALHVLALGMFGVGFASAANGLPALSIAQTLYQIEHPVT